MMTITKYHDPQGSEITEQWWADAEGTRHHVAALTDGQRQALGITTAVEDVAPPEPPSVADLASAFVFQISYDVTAAYRDAIGGREYEYAETERQALAFKAAGYSGDVPRYVAIWVERSGKTAQAAADDILAKADALRAAAGDMRDAHLTHKDDALAATTSAEIDALRVSWAAAVGQFRAAVGA